MNYPSKTLSIKAKEESENDEVIATLGHDWMKVKVALRGSPCVIGRSKVPSCGDWSDVSVGL